LLFQGMLLLWDLKFFAEDSGLPGCDAASWGMRSLMVLGLQSFRMLINTHPVILHHIPENCNPYWLWTEFTVILHSYLMGLESHPSLVYISGLFLYWVFYKCVTVSLKVTVFFVSCEFTFSVIAATFYENKCCYYKHWYCICPSLRQQQLELWNLWLKYMRWICIIQPVSCFVQVQD
jgi:hypothetical protein